MDKIKLFDNENQTAVKWRNLNWWRNLTAEGMSAVPLTAD